MRVVVLPVPFLLATICAKYFDLLVVVVLSDSAVVDVSTCVDVNSIVVVVNSAVLVEVISVVLVLSGLVVKQDSGDSLVRLSEDQIVKHTPNSNHIKSSVYTV